MREFKMENIKLQGYRGTWSEIDRVRYHGVTYYLLENDQMGEDVAGIVIDDDMHVVADDCYSGINVALGDLFGCSYESFEI